MERYGGRRGYWVPRTCGELREALRKMGVKRIGGKPLGRVRKKQLYAVYFAMRDRGQRMEGRDE